METIKRLFVKYKEIILYIIFGVLTTLVNWAVYAATVPAFSAAFNGEEVMWTVFGREITYDTFAIFLANVVAWIAGVAFAFVTNKLFVFESKSWKPAVALKEFWLFVAARLITGVMEWFFPSLLFSIGLDQSIFGIKGFAAKILVSVVVIILNYVFSKLIIFRKKDGGKEQKKLEEAATQLAEAEKEIKKKAKQHHEE